ncbi:MAG: class A beta-lactamase-related serine hydrolase, partial [Sphingobacteriales bacterium]
MRFIVAHTSRQKPGDEMLKGHGRAKISMAMVCCTGCTKITQSVGLWLARGHNTFAQTKNTFPMKKQILTGMLLAAGLSGLHAQPNFPTVWGNHMQAVLDSVNAAQGNAIGVTAAIYMPGRGLWTGASGISAPGVPMTTDMRVLIASNTKLFTAVTLLKLQEQGILSLDDHIGRWIHYGPATVDTTATIRQLLSHESGMGDWNNDHIDEA